MILKNLKITKKISWLNILNAIKSMFILFIMRMDNKFIENKLFSIHIFSGLNIVNLVSLFFLFLQS